MKKILIVALLLMTSQVLTAQTPAAVAVKPGSNTGKEIPAFQRQYFCCPSCDYTAKVMRSCPVHQLSLVRVGDWYCPSDGKSFPAAGKCGVHKGNLVRMELKYQTVTPKPADMKKSEPVH